MRVLCVQCAPAACTDSPPTHAPTDAHTRAHTRAHSPAPPLTHPPTQAEAAGHETEAHYEKRTREAAGKVRGGAACRRLGWGGVGWGVPQHPLPPPCCRRPKPILGASGLPSHPHNSTHAYHPVHLPKPQTTRRPTRSCCRRRARTCRTPRARAGWSCPAQVESEGLAQGEGARGRGPSGWQPER